MIRRPEGYDTVSAMRAGESSAIPAGWYKATILKAEGGETQSGAAYVDFFVDIIDGQYARYYEKDYKNQSPNVNGEKKWRGVYRQFTEGKSTPFFKGAITAIEDSNDGFHFDFDETKLKGKLIGLGIRREEFESADGARWTSKPYAFCDIKKVIAGEMPVPKDKPLNTTSVRTQSYAPPSYIPPGYTTPAASSTQTAAPAYPKLEELGDDEDLPF